MRFNFYKGCMIVLFFSDHFAWYKKNRKIIIKLLNRNFSCKILQSINQLYNVEKLISVDNTVKRNLSAMEKFGKHFIKSLFIYSRFLMF